MAHLLAWYFRDQWISGYVCGIVVMFVARGIADAIRWREKQRR